jgi:hypothetical protein
MVKGIFEKNDPRKKRKNRVFCQIVGAMRFKEGRDGKEAATALKKTAGGASGG